MDTGLDSPIDTPIDTSRLYRLPPIDTPIDTSIEYQMVPSILETSMATGGAGRGRHLALRVGGRS